VGSDGLGGGLSVGQAGHAGREDIIGEDPTIGIGGRSSGVIGEDVGKQSERRGYGLFGRVAVILEKRRPGFEVVLDIAGGMPGVEVVSGPVGVDDGVDGGMAASAITGVPKPSAAWSTSTLATTACPPRCTTPTGT
jgi:hypothetical protein